MSAVAIIGAGVSGLSAAWKLSQRGYELTIFEKSRGVSGRAATRGKNSARYDHGANYFKASDPEVHELITQILPTDDLVEIPGDVCTFDQNGNISPGDPKHNAEPKLNYRDGISRLGKLLAEASGASIQNQNRVGHLCYKNDQWELFDDNGSSLGIFDQVLTTIPAPQCASVIQKSEFDEKSRTSILEGLGSSRYYSQFSFILGYDIVTNQDRNYHALVNVDGKHAIAWMSHEEDKAGHVPDGQSLIIVQMSPAWSAERLEMPREDLLTEALKHLSGLLPGVDIQPTWWDSQRWMMAHPESACDISKLAVGESMKLWFSGDSLAGKGRVHLAIKSGLDAARQIIAKTN